MSTQLLIGFLLTIAPITELRIGLPIIIDYCSKNNLPIAPYFIAVLILNILVIFLIFAFLDFVHHELLRIKIYRKFAEHKIKKAQRKAKKIEARMQKMGYLPLMLFVAVPLPGTGAWTGSLIAWLLGLDRKKSIIAISAGVIIAGLVILFASLSILKLI